MIAFAGPIATGGDGLIVSKGDNKDYKTLDDLKGLAVVTQAGPYRGNSGLGVVRGLIG